MTTTFITPGSVEAQSGIVHRALSAWKECASPTDPLTIEGPDRSTLTLTGVTCFGYADTGRYIVRVTRNHGARSEFYPITVTFRPNGGYSLMVYATDQMPARERTLANAVAHSKQLMAEAQRQLNEAYAKARAEEAAALRGQVAVFPASLPVPA